MSNPLKPYLQVVRDSVKESWKSTIVGVCMLGFGIFGGEDVSIEAIVGGIALILSRFPVKPKGTAVLILLCVLMLPGCVSTESGRDVEFTIGIRIPFDKDSPIKFEPSGK